MSPTFRPTITGEVVNATALNSPVSGVLVTIQSSAADPSDKKEMDEGLRPEIIVSTVTAGDGTFSLPGERMVGGGVIGAVPFIAFRVRFHRDDFRDAIYDFNYYNYSSSPVLRKLPLGLIPLRPNASLPPSSQPAAPVDVISR